MPAPASEAPLEAVPEPELEREPGLEPEHESEVATGFPPASPYAAADTQPDFEPFEQLIASADADRLRRRWSEVQAGFIDDPAGSVQRADELAGEIVNALGQAIAERKRSLDDHGRDDTEQLRLTLRAYREFVDRMLAA
ncbi:hypothetical protein J4573_39900 [Actinomadura barringtoniae]|uniref:Uncharacterized protein n=1 Tax=Actinomadura barringtoniae TaxID=1427535 RepID=A0A939PIL2_9ACTN|nr:hypothetical protein [Actinomadura barringtoniae]MBO2453315.1 hypothetical protein [Actinomadura barringtoniae]